MYQWYINGDDSNRPDSLRYLWSTFGIAYSPGLLATNFYSKCPMSFAETFDGLIIMANGIDEFHRWNGVTPYAVPCGVSAPTTAPQVSAQAIDDTESNEIYSVTFDYTEFRPRVGIGASFGGGSSSGLNASGRSGSVFRATALTSAASAADAITGDRHKDYAAFKNRFVDPEEAKKAFFGVKKADAETQMARIAAHMGAQRINSFLGGAVLNVASYQAQQSAQIAAYWEIPPKIKFTLRVYRQAGGSALEDGPISGKYSVFQRFVDIYGNVSNPSPMSQEIDVTGAHYLVYRDVEAPVDPKIVKRQIWRNTDNQFQTWYLDIETTNLTATSFASNKTDAELQMQPNLPVWTADGQPLAHLYWKPPSNKAHVVSYNNHMIACGERAYDEGCAVVTYGSTTVTGLGNNFKNTFMGRFFYTPATPAGIEIVDVDETANTLMLAEPYPSADDDFSDYEIKAAPAERELIYWSEPGLPEAWMPTNSAALPVDGDEITGIGVHNGNCLIMKRSALYSFKFATTPRIDGVIRKVAARGCISPRCAVSTEAVAFMMDYNGIHVISSSGESAAISQPISDLFRSEDTDSGLKINWSHDCLFHAIHQPEAETVRFFVSMSGYGRLRHAICYQYARQIWWIEEYPFPITASCQAFIQNLRPIVGGPNGEVFVLDSGPLDLVTPGNGEVRGLVEEAYPTMLVLDFEPGESAVGAPIAIVSGQGKNQTNIIVDVDGDAVYLKWPFNILPAASGDDKSKVQIGGIPCRWKSGAHQYGERGARTSRDVHIDYRSSGEEGSFDLLVYRDGLQAPVEQVADRDEDYVSAKREDDHVTIDTVNPLGMAKVILDGHQEPDTRNRNMVELEIKGFSSEEKLRIHKITMQGVASKNG